MTAATYWCVFHDDLLLLHREFVMMIAGHSHPSVSLLHLRQGWHAGHAAREVRRCAFLGPDVSFQSQQLHRLDCMMGDLDQASGATLPWTLDMTPDCDIVVLTRPSAEVPNRKRTASPCMRWFHCCITWLSSLQQDVQSHNGRETCAVGPVEAAKARARAGREVALAAVRAVDVALVPRLSCADAAKCDFATAVGLVDGRLWVVA